MVDLATKAPREALLLSFNDNLHLLLPTQEPFFNAQHTMEDKERKYGSHNG